MENNIEFPVSEKKSKKIPLIYGCSKKGLVFPGASINEVVSIRNLQEVLMDIEFSEDNRIQKLFFIGPDMLARDIQDLKKILKTSKEKFKNLKTINGYAMPRSVIENDIDALKKEGLTGIYLGVSPFEGEEILNSFKYNSREEEVKASKKINDSGIELYISMVVGYAKCPEELVEHLKKLNPKKIEIRIPRVKNVVPMPPNKEYVPLPDMEMIDREINYLEKELGNLLWIENL